jgi:benzoyl-CoA 2,3-dioxygenase component B
VEIIKSRGLIGEWEGLFQDWQKDRGLPGEDIEYLAKRVKMEPLYGRIPERFVEFGDYQGEPKYERLLQVPDQRARDVLIEDIDIQGDTEFASVEQQVHLLGYPPSHMDYKHALILMAQEMRHGVQMCDVLLSHFGDSGKRYAERLLERNALAGTRRLGAFNGEVRNWLGFWLYTAFQDRDGKYQLVMWWHSSFAPMGSSMSPMLQEEGFHIFVGLSGLCRVVEANVVPRPLIQRYINEIFPKVLDLFGGDYSSMAEWRYVWGLKGRYDENRLRPASRGQKEDLNGHNRRLFIKECQEQVIDKMNRYVKNPAERLYLPSEKFNRQMGQYRDKHYDVFGNPLADDKWESYIKSVLPNDDTDAEFDALTREKHENGWITRAWKSSYDED